MPINSIYSYLVHPGKSAGEPVELQGSDVPLEGRLYDLLAEVYTRSDTECDIDICFNQGQDGSQNNPCRSPILSHLRDPTLDTARSLADRLRDVTTRRSGLGLVFLIAGPEEGGHKIVVSRFPAHSAILAETGTKALSLAFLERVFMKSAYSYKAAVYRDTSLTAGFWTGKAVDKQIKGSEKETSDYWIKDFLDSDFSTTPGRGTRRLADALKAAVARSGDLTVKRQIASAVTLAEGLADENMSVNDFMDRFNFSTATREEVLKGFRDPSVPAEHFKFDAMVFMNQLPYRSIELNSGAILTAPSPDFDEVFSREELDGEDGECRYSTKGPYFCGFIRSILAARRSGDAWTHTASRLVLSAQFWKTSQSRAAAT